MINIDSKQLKKIAIFLFFIMFIYSGIDKSLNFTSKTKALETKINLPYSICMIGMILVILLEVFGSLIIFYNILNPSQLKYYTNYVYILFLVFLIVVTLVYHPPNKKMIPFLSNLTTFGGLLYLYGDFLSKK